MNSYIRFNHTDDERSAEFEFHISYATYDNDAPEITGVKLVEVAHYYDDYTRPSDGIDNLVERPPHVILGHSGIGRDEKTGQLTFTSRRRADDPIEERVISSWFLRLMENQPLLRDEVNEQICTTVASKSTKPGNEGA